MDLKSMTIQELDTLLGDIKKEIAARSAVPELVLYTHDCQKSAKYHLTKYKHWAKAVRSVDLTKTNGYAFIGDFLAITTEHKLPIDTIVVEVCDKDVTAYQVTAAGKVKVAEAKTNSMSSLIQKVADVIG